MDAPLHRQGGVVRRVRPEERERLLRLPLGDQHAGQGDAQRRIVRPRRLRLAQQGEGTVHVAARAQQPGALDRRARVMRLQRQGAEKGKVGAVGIGRLKPGGAEPCPRIGMIRHEAHGGGKGAGSVVPVAGPHPRRAEDQLRLGKTRRPQRRAARLGQRRYGRRHVSARLGQVDPGRRYSTGQIQKTAPISMMKPPLITSP